MTSAAHQLPGPTGGGGRIARRLARPHSSGSAQTMPKRCWHSCARCPTKTGACVSFRWATTWPRTAHDEANVDYVQSLGLLATVGPDRTHRRPRAVRAVRRRTSGGRLCDRRTSTRAGVWRRCCSGNWLRPRPATASTPSKRSSCPKTVACWMSSVTRDSRSRPSTTWTPST